MAERESRPSRTASSGVLGLVAALLLSGCFGDTRTTTVADPSGGGAGLKAFAFEEMKKQARRTCAAVPRDILATGLLDRSDAPPAGNDPSSYNDNNLALLYVEDIRISPIRLQTAAYDGCRVGLRDQARALRARNLDPGRVAFQDAGAKLTCPARLVDDDSPEICTLAFEDVAMRQCEDRGPGGFDLMASGISCRAARQLRLPLGSRTFSSYRRAGEGVYRPWLATGRFTDPKPTEPIGWTCWHRWDPETPQGGVRHVCWSGSAIVLFKIG